MGNICCGFGHRNVFCNIGGELSKIVENLISENCVDVFYTGGMGDFDREFCAAVRKAKHNHNDISLVLVKPYFSNELNSNREYYEYYYDDVLIFGEGEPVHPKAAIGKRNRWMVDKSHYIIGYLYRDYGGAYNAIQYAKKQGKEVLMIKK